MIKNIFRCRQKPFSADTKSSPSLGFCVLLLERGHTTGLWTWGIFSKVSGRELCFYSDEGTGLNYLLLCWCRTNHYNPWLQQGRWLASGDECHRSPSMRFEKKRSPPALITLTGKAKVMARDAVAHSPCLLGRTCRFYPPFSALFPKSLPLVHHFMWLTTLLGSCSSI